MSVTDIEKLRVPLPHAAEHLVAAVEKLAGVSRDLDALLAHLGGPMAVGEHDHQHNKHGHYHGHAD